MKSTLIEDIMKRTSLEIRVKVAIQAYFINEFGGTMLIPLDKNGKELPEALAANKICFDKAKPLVDHVLEEIKKWKEDGCPN